MVKIGNNSGHNKSLLALLIIKAQNTDFHSTCIENFSSGYNIDRKCRALLNMKEIFGKDFLIYIHQVNTLITFITHDYNM